MNTTPRIKNLRSTVPGKIPTVEQLELGVIGINHADAVAYIRRERVGFPSDVVTIGAGVSVPNVFYVSTNGSDTNNGTTLGDAFASIKKAASVAQPSATIKVIAGNYTEDNPIKLPDQISIIGSSLREVSISPQNQGDLFHVGNGNYISDMSFVGSSNTGAIGAFDEFNQRYITQSPYFRNCTNFIPDSTGLRIDGNHALGPLKSMVVDSFTQNQSGGIGVSITNEAYAQLVSIFTITNGIGIYCGDGGGCDITNSNSSFGDYGLVADGIGPEKYVGIITESVEINSNIFKVYFDVPTFNVNDTVYDNTTGIATITVDSPHNFNVGMSVSMAGLAFTCNSGPGKTYSVIDADYDNITGIATITLNETHDFYVGYGVTISGLGFTCTSGPTELYYPSGANGYNFEILEVNTSSSFTVNVGISTITHYYNSGGSVSLDPAVYTFPSGVNGYIYDIKDIPSPTSFVINGGISTFTHTYMSGGTITLDVVRPYDGQVIYIDDLYYVIDSVQIGSAGTGYINQPIVTVESPPTAWGIDAQYTATIQGGSVIEINEISSGRGYYSTPPNITISSPDVGVNTATATAIMKPAYYSILSSTPISSGISTITLSESIPYSVGIGSTVPFFRQSRIIASSHSFEYVGSGVTLLNALPFRGGITIQDNEVVSKNGGLVVYTSTDQRGDFRIGDDVSIDQSTATIAGRAFSQSLLNTVTPLIIALGGD
jgi:hypothetical protein